MMNENKEKMWSWVLYLFSMVLAVISALGAALQCFLRIRPFCEGCKEIGCGICELEFGSLTFVAWILGLVLFIAWGVMLHNKKRLILKTKSISIEKIALIIGIIVLCLYLIPLFAFLVPMFLPPSMN